MPHGHEKAEERKLALHCLALRKWKDHDPLRARIRLLNRDKEQIAAGERAMDRLSSKR